MQPLLTYLLTPAGLTTVLIVVNAAAFTAFGFDKLQAEAGRWRVAESTLLLFALLGGTLGAYAGRAAFRHKTRKQPFSAQLHVIAALQAAGLVAWAGGWIG
jgi:uncharacterized membrane protein YsdA (DUF1294 family)